MSAPSRDALIQSALSQMGFLARYECATCGCTHGLTWANQEPSQYPAETDIICDGCDRVQTLKRTLSTEVQSDG